MGFDLNWISLVAESSTIMDASFTQYRKTLQHRLVIPPVLDMGVILCTSKEFCRIGNIYINRNICITLEFSLHFLMDGQHKGEYI